MSTGTNSSNRPPVLRRPKRPPKRDSGVFAIPETKPEPIRFPEPGAIEREFREAQKLGVKR